MQSNEIPKKVPDYTLEQCNERIAHYIESISNAKDPVVLNARKNLLQFWINYKNKYYGQSEE